METNEIPTKPVSNWQPITNKHELAILGKLGEESGELISALFRCIIQGLDEHEPETKKINRRWLEDEIADVLAMIHLATERLRLHTTEIEKRRERKID